MKECAQAQAVVIFVEDCQACKSLQLSGSSRNRKLKRNKTKKQKNRDAERKRGKKRRGLQGKVQSVCAYIGLVQDRQCTSLLPTTDNCVPSTLIALIGLRPMQGLTSHASTTPWLACTPALPNTDTTIFPPPICLPCQLRPSPAFAACVSWQKHVMQLQQLDSLLTYLQLHDTQVLCVCVCECVLNRADKSITATCHFPVSNLDLNICLVRSCWMAP